MSAFLLVILVGAVPTLLHDLSESLCETEC